MIRNQIGVAVRILTRVREENTLSSNMAIHPLIRRQFRAEIAAYRVRNIRWWVAGIGFLTGALFLLLTLDNSAKELGRTFFRAATLTCLALLSSRTLHTAATLFDAERESGVLDLLSLAGVRPLEVFATKLAGHLLFTLNAGLGFFPFMVLAFTFNGLPITSFWEVMAFLPLLLVLSSAVAVFASVFSKPDGTSAMIANLILLVLCGLPLVFYYLSEVYGGVAGPLWWRALSPANVVWFIFNAESPMSRPMFLLQAATILLYSLIFTGAASRLFLRAWKTTHESGAWGRSSPVDHRTNRLRNLWLATNPFIWASYRSKNGIVRAWAILLLIVAVWALCWLTWGEAWIHPLNVLLTAALLNQTLMFLILHAGAQRMAMDRQTGALELLLTTPLSTRDIAEGHKSAVLSQFSIISMVAWGFNVFLLAIGLTHRSWNLGSATSYCLCWLIVFFLGPGRTLRSFECGQWIALNIGRTDIAVTRAGFGGVGTSLLFQLWWVPKIFSKTGRAFPQGDLLELIVLGVIAVFFSLVYFVPQWHYGSFAERTIESMRSIAQRSLPAPSDKRLKNWDIRKAFPEPEVNQSI